MRKSSFVAAFLAACFGGGELIVACVGDDPTARTADLSEAGPNVDAAPPSNDGGSDAADGASSTDAAGDAAAPLPPSCRSGTTGVTSCAGAAGCCTSPLVSSGMFNRTYQVTFQGPTNQADPATVSAFRLDQYEVTVGRFRNFVHDITSATGAPPTSGSGKHVHLNGGKGLANAGSAGGFEQGWDSADWNFAIASGAASVDTWNTNLTGGTWTAGNEALPISNVSWFEAVAFCIWDGGFLPSDAELEYAEAGGDAQRLYPWGSADPDPTCTGGCIYAVFGCNYPAPTPPASCGIANIAPVGTTSKGYGRWGQLDLSGNVAEYTLDRGNTDIASPYRGPCVDCAEANVAVGKGNGRTNRGGAFNVPLTLAPQRFPSDPPLNRSPAIGFRCARTP